MKSIIKTVLFSYQYFDFNLSNKIDHRQSKSKINGIYDQTTILAWNFL